MSGQMPVMRPEEPFEAPTEQKKTYTAVCRCQATKFTITLPSLMSVEYCNCTYCVSKDILWLDGKQGDLVFERKGPMTAYEFGRKKITFNFCSLCGNFIHDLTKATGHIKINARLLENVDMWNLERKLQNDFSKDPVPLPPPFTGPDFERLDAGDGKKSYLGYCHCRAVTMALRTKPFPEQRILQCNCSWCIRWGAVHWHPPSTNEIHFGGWDNLSAYKSPKAFWSAQFCKTCGDQFVIIGMGEGHEPKDEHGQLIEDSRAKLGYDGRVYCVNVRVLKDFEWDKVDIGKFPGRNAREPFEVK